MQKNNKGQTIIHSVSELSAEERQLVRLGSIGGGALVLAIYFPILLLLGIGPSKQDPLFGCLVVLGVLFVWAVVLCWQGVYWGRYLMAANLGYAFATPLQTFAHNTSQNASFSSSDAVHYASSRAYHNHTSINPSSGFPMSGSSGIDTHGNPFGTRSW